jgi:hypothetical protein
METPRGTKVPARIVASGWSECRRLALKRVRFPVESLLSRRERESLEVLARMLKTTVEELLEERAKDVIPW